MTKEYVIEKLNDIFQIPEDKFGKFIGEFAAALHSVYYTQRAIAETAKVMGVPAPTPHIPRMVWKDDDAKEIKINVEVKAVVREAPPAVKEGEGD